MTIKEKYDFLIENICSENGNEFPDRYMPVYVPDFFNENRYEPIDVDDAMMTFNVKLLSDATEEEMEDYIYYVLDYLGLTEEYLGWDL